MKKNKSRASLKSRNKQQLGSKEAVLPSYDTPYIQSKEASKIVDALSLFLSLPEYPKFFWHNPNQNLSFVVSGARERIDGKTLLDLQAYMKHFPYDMPFFGGLAFNPDSNVETQWASFGSSCFFLPKLCYQVLGSKASISYLAKDKEELKELKAVFDESIKHQNHLNKQRLQKPLGSFVGFTNTLSESLEMIESAKKRFCQGNLQKLVLSRVAQFDIKATLEQLLFSVFMKKNGNAFCFQPSESELFFGQSPEELLSWDETHFTTAAIAGTIKRGASLQEEGVLKDRFLNSKKDVLEHKLVADYIEAIAQKYAKGSLEKYESILNLWYISHFKKEFKGLFKKPNSWGLLANELHPTPALSGFPKKEALDALLALESNSRGWYGGVLGFCHPHYGQLQVAIRSALLSGNQLRAYVGAGIMPDSIAKDEVDEMCLKLSWLLDALDVSGL